MKEVKRSPEELAVYINRIVRQAVKSPSILYKVIYHTESLSSLPKSLLLKNKTKQTTSPAQSLKGGRCDTANKENQLACAHHWPENLQRDSWTYLVLSTDSSTS